jgi:hypothetical protein
MEVLVMLLVKHVPPLPTPPLSNVPLVPIKQLQPVTQDIMEIPVILLVKCVLPVLPRILEQILGQRHVRHVTPDPLQILEPVLGQQRVLLVLLAYIRRHRALLHVRPVPALPTPPLSNAPPISIKK